MKICFQSSDTNGNGEYGSGKGEIGETKNAVIVKSVDEESIKEYSPTAHKINSVAAFLFPKGDFCCSSLNLPHGWE